MSSPGVLDLEFRLALEFALPPTLNATRDPDNIPPAVALTAEAVTTAGLPVAFVSEDGNDDSNMYESPEMWEMRRREWVLQPNGRIQLQGEYQTWVPLILGSPMMSERDIEQDYPELSRVLNTILVAHQGNVHIHPSFDLRVQVSLPGVSTLRTAKRLATLCLLLEEFMLWPLCPRRRRDSYGSLDRDQCRIQSTRVRQRTLLPRGHRAGDIGHPEQPDSSDGPHAGKHMEVPYCARIKRGPLRGRRQVYQAAGCEAEVAHSSW